jgi:hypothetical protein
MVLRDPESSSQFEYRGEGNFFASSEMCGDRCADSEGDKDENKDEDRDEGTERQLEYDLTSSG